MIQLGSGAWGLMSVQVDRGSHTERNNPGIFLIDQLQVAKNVQQSPRYRSPADLRGVTIDPGVNVSGMVMLTERPAAGGNFSSALDADASAAPSPTFATTNVKIDRKVRTKEDLPPDTPIGMTFEIPANQVNNADFILGMHFGGPVSSDKRGSYYLSFRGDGYCILSEQVDTSDGWQALHSFVYCAPNEIAGAHTVLITPHRDVKGGGLIDFQVNRVGGYAGALNLLTSYHQPQARPVHWTYTIKGFKDPLPDGSQRVNVIGRGPLRIDARQDIRTWYQPSVLKYLSPGLLIDYPFFIPWAATGDLTILWNAVIPDGCSIVGRLFDASTAAELTQTASGDNYATYTPTADQPFYYATFEFNTNTDADRTPLLWGYSVTQDSVYAATTVSTFTVPSDGGILRSVSFTGPEKDPTHETGQMLVEDPANIIARLNNRAGIPFTLSTTYDPTDLTKESVLGSGYITRATATRRGTAAPVGFGGNRGGRVFPAQGWRQYELTTVGEWKRLQESLTFVRLDLQMSPDVDPADMSGFTLLPYKVTDVCRLMIGWAGYPDTMIDVPDNPTRFFQGGTHDGLLIEPLTSIGDWVVKILREYLGWFLIWDANAGTMGMWRVRPPTLPDGSGNYTPLASFTTSAPSGTMAVHPSSYDGRAASASPGPYVGTSGQIASAPILKRKAQSTLKTYVKEAEANAILVTGTGALLPNGAGQWRNSQFAVNVNAFNLPGATVADGSNPDYAGGYFKPLAVYDPTLFHQTPVDFLTRRYYDISVHAIKMAEFEAPLVLVVDPTDTMQANPRPLRYYDPIKINGSDWLVRSCNLFYTKGNFQYMRLECEAPREVS